MTKFTFIERFDRIDELNKWKLAKQLSWGTTNSCLIRCTLCPASTHKMHNVIASCTNKDCIKTSYAQSDTKYAHVSVQVWSRFLRKVNIAAKPSRARHTESPQRLRNSLKI